MASKSKTNAINNELLLKLNTFSVFKVISPNVFLEEHEILPFLKQNVKQ